MTSCLLALQIVIRTQFFFKTSAKSKSRRPKLIKRFTVHLVYVAFKLLDK